ncbi:MAG: hypothetical protein M1831_002640 [Alyxoria varia]|nr:MAG: hypothetical protein M1831_002640 [Alyxoria varia]
MAPRATAYKRQTASKTSGNIKSSSPGQKTPPAPFSHAPDSLLPFLQSETSPLDRTKVYIAHLDRTPRDFKRNIFMVPLAQNILLAILLAWRLWVAAPMYMDWVLLVLGYPTSAYVDHTVKPNSQLAWTLVRRFANMAFDYGLFVVAVPWVKRFCFGTPASPLAWRWKVECRDEEVVFRVSRGSDAITLWEAYDSGQGEQENAVMAHKIMPAIDKYWMHERTGYQMIGKDWGLDFASMIRATELIDQGKMSLKSFEKTVLAYSDAHGWLAWQVHPLDEKVAEEEAREKIVQFKDRLTAMGKENLFFRWIELIQYESNRPGGFTAERQADAVDKAKGLFEDQGVDFEEFLRSIGGIQGVPGFEQTNTQPS